MYKVKEAADQLGVSRVEIFEILLSQRDIFEPFVTKKNSITYISEEGLLFLKERLVVHQGTNLEQTDLQKGNLKIDDGVLPKNDESQNTKDLAESEGELFVDTTETDFDVASGEELETQENINPQGWRDSRDNTEFEQVDDALSDWLSEIQDETILSDSYDLKLREIRSQITTTRNKILGLDSEIKMKEDALRHYHEIMKDDIRWLEDLERKMQIIVKNRFLENDSAMESLEVSDEEKSNFRKFFKR